MQLPQWYLVANAARARLLAREQGEPLQLVRAFGHVQSRMRSSELDDDKAGREIGASGFGAGAFRPRTGAHDKERHRFAHELARFLDLEARQGRFATLAVFAPSPFLGDLKHELGAATVHRLAAAEDLDFTHASLRELEGHFAGAPGH